ncbi:Zinc finger protein CONSTANS-LIKE 4 [Arabidopsis thaliana]|uniref:COL4 n=2 Tax=Arabidopsis TaxID=3701 RepID=A0A178UN26_ARATH|nr:B-box-type zinc finger [Arabidopsis thaliana x Arabidopsis arenosa]OAO95198.1 COL4 [Arabidopsis thaliana]
MASKLCDSCKSATAALYCRPDAAFLCLSCDSKVHAANKLASRHARVWMCEVCEQAPAHVTCKADAAALCVTCDRDIHSANPLARRHERVPVTPFYDSVSSDGSVKHTAVNFLDDCYFSDIDGNGSREEEEEEAASWLLLPNPKTTTTATAGIVAVTSAEEVPGDSPEMNTGQQYLFSDPDPYLDLDYGNVDPKVESLEQNSSGTDGVVPVENRTVRIPTVNENCFEMDFTGGSKGFAYGGGYNCISHSVSSSSMEVGVVPDGGSVADLSYPYGGPATSGADPGTQRAVPLTSAEREARVMRYREKRKNRKFEKTIRYASRKAYAEMRPRIKGRFAKRTDTNESNDVVGHGGIFSGFGLVPTF